MTLTVVMAGLLMTGFSLVNFIQHIILTEMLNYFSAIAIGIATGYGLCFPVNAFVNEAALNRCETQTKTHRIVSLGTIAGPSYSCVKREF